MRRHTGQGILSRPEDDICCAMASWAPKTFFCLAVECDKDSKSVVACGAAKDLLPAVAASVYFDDYDQSLLDWQERAQSSSKLLC